MKKILLILIAFCLLSVTAKVAHADAVTDNALNFLKSKQDASGRITTGFSAPSQWSAIAFSIHNIDVATVKNADKSLLEFLQSDIPASPSAATDWESKILAIVAIGGNPTDFGGVNFVQQLETFYTDSQLGDVCLLNDDIYGLLALVAAGDTATAQIKSDTLAFLISKQDPVDGGFGFSAPGCSWYETSADMTAVGIQALVAAKEHGVTHSELDNSITRAKAYLLANQLTDGGFGYYGFSDPDSTNQVLQAFNVLGVSNSSEAAAARNYLLSLQSATDGGFTAYDWGTGIFVSNATTTAQSVIALSGKGFIVKIFDPASVASPSATPTVTVTPTVTTTPISTPTPTASPSNNQPTNTPTPTPTPTQAPAAASSTNLDDLLSSPLASEVYDEEEEEDVLAQITSVPEERVLAAADEKKATDTNTKGMFIARIFAGLGVLFIFIYLAKPFIIRRFK
jgi:hypothetical protein